MVFYENIMTYPESNNSFIVYELIDADKAWERFNNLITRDKDEDFNPDTIINDLRSKGYIN